MVLVLFQKATDAFSIQSPGVTSCVDDSVVFSGMEIYHFGQCRGNNSNYKTYNFRIKSGKCKKSISYKTYPLKAYKYRYH